MNNELYHYGVKGMKWGVRRYQPYGTGGYNPESKGGIFKPSQQRKKDKATKKWLKRSIKEQSDIYGSEASKIRNEYRDAMGNDPEYLKNRSKQRMLDDTYSSHEYIPVVDEVIDYKRREAARKASASARRIGQEYVNRLNEAVLKDIKYNGDIEEGQKLLRKFNREYYIGPDGVIKQRKGVFSRSVYDYEYDLGGAY